MKEIENLIIGAGLSGLMMAELLKDDYAILEAGPQVRTHIPISYFLHSIVPWLPTEFEQVVVHTNGYNGRDFYLNPTIRDMNDYSIKIAGKIVSYPFKAFDTHLQKWYLPANGEPGQIIKDLLKGKEGKIFCNSKIIKINLEDKSVELANGKQIGYRNLISTLPLPILLQMIDIDFKADFSTRPIFTAAYRAEGYCASDACQVVYISDRIISPYRATLVKNIVIFEGMVPLTDSENKIVLNHFWHIDKVEKIEERIVNPGKFNPLDKSRRRALLGMLTSKHNIYCLGRYAIWDHKVTDEVAKDAEAILDIIKAKELV